MKKAILTIVCVAFCLIKVQAQNDTIVTVPQLSQVPGKQIRACENKYDRVILYAPEGCNSCTWRINGEWIDNVSFVIFDKAVAEYWSCKFYGCGYDFGFDVFFIEPNVPTEVTSQLWKRQYESITLQAPGGSYSYHWSTGATTSSIQVTEPGTYTCGVSDMCATSMQTFIVQDNIEIYRATVDLATGLNKVTWPTTPEQAEYISQVKVERDGFVVGTAPYEDGQFMDNIGSENAARNYRLTGITTEGAECPIPSYQLGTLHVDFSPNASNPNKLNMAWTAPFIEEGASLTVTYFQICKYDPATGEVTVVDQIGANNTIGSYDVNLFDGGYATVAAVFSTGRDYEELSFSNLTDDILGIGENEGAQFRVYPNPANNVLFVETRRATSLQTETYRIMNPIGQTVMQGEITTEKHQIDVRNLPKGVYFITVGGATRKFVVQ